MTNQALLDELTAMTCDLVAMPSTADKPDQLRATIDYAEGYMRDIPGLYLHRGEYKEKPYLIATLHQTKTPTIMLNAHLDVVPGYAEQFHPRIENGRIYGRATQDMKGSGAVLLRLLKDLAALPSPPNVGFMFVTDEEIGGEDGTGYLLRQGWRCEFFLAAEPTDLEICYSHKGPLWVEVHLDGEPAHGSRPWDGTNAIVTMREGLVALEQRYPTPREAVWRTTAVPTVINGGDANNRLPKHLALTLDVRRVPEEPLEDVMESLKSCFPAGDVRLIASGPPLATDPQDATVQKLAQVITAVTGQKAGFFQEHFATDARFYSDVGIPSVCVGPVGAGLHSDNEWVEIASLGTLYDILWQFTNAC